MKAFGSFALLSLASCWTPEHVLEREPHGRYVAVTYTWEDLWGPCPKSHSEQRLYDSDGNLVVRGLSALSDSPDGRWTLGKAAEGRYSTFLIDHRAGTIRSLEGHDDLVSPGCWSPRGSRILLRLSSDSKDAHGLVLLDVDPEPAAFTTLFARPWGHSQESVTWSPDGRSIAFFDRGPGQSFELVQYRIDPAPAEDFRQALEKVGTRWWERYEIRWGGERAVAVPRR